MEYSKAHQTKKNLFKMAMEGNWDGVVEIYAQNPWIRGAKITRSGATALHIAVYNNEEDIVEKLIKVIESGTSMSPKKVLTIGDELGNTPLHTAAALGKVKMCECIAGVEASLIGIRNNDGETPFFVAALHGHKQAFFRLHDLCQDGKGYEYSRRNDGETILHCAISGDYFDLAFQIIHLYEHLVNSRNEQGLSPLHLLATKPSAFRSGSHLGRGNALIYHSIYIEKLKVEKSRSQFSPENSDVVKEPKHQTFYNLIRPMWKVFVTKNASKGTEGGGKPNASDAENPVETMNTATEAAQDKGNTEGPAEDEDNIKAQGHQLLRPIYSAPFEFVKLAYMTMLIILGLGSTKIRNLLEKKQKHTWSVQVMNELLQRTSSYEYEFDGGNPLSTTFGDEEDDQGTESSGFDAGGDKIFPFGEDAFDENEKPVPTNKPSRANHLDKKGKVLEMEKKESPILIAAKNGITEIVENVLEKFPVAIHDVNYQQKNVVLLAAENRQPHVYQLLLKKPNILKESVFRKVDHEGNSALHLAAKLGEKKPWLIPGAALQMQWETNWYKFIKKSMSFHFFVHYNKQNQSPKHIFTDSHKDLVKAGHKWLTKTSESYSIVAALIASIAFTTSTQIPGGNKDETGMPTLKNEPAFNLFAISSLVALCFSVTSLIMFLAILTSRYEEKDYNKDLPRKLLLGLTSLFVSISSMLIAFCAANFFLLKDELTYAAWPVYAVTCLPITFFAIAQFPLYFDLIWASFKKVPERSYKPISN